METFNYSVSHDLQAPLRAVEGFSQFLREGYSAQLNSEARGYLDRISAATARMDQLIKGLLNLSRISRFELRRRPVNLSTLAEGIASELRESDPKRDVEFTIVPNLCAEGDPELLRSVLHNLIGNAWKYTSQHKHAHIEFGDEQKRGERVFYVRDDGAGFKQEHAGKLFNPFQRLHGVNEFPGTGIGLTIVHRILQRHGGRIWAEGKKDKGATFYFTIPKKNGQ
jgi:light-regulated signal transduction histidine kinase (bacteriophytochrome)